MRTSLAREALRVAFRAGSAADRKAATSSALSISSREIDHKDARALTALQVEVGEALEKLTISEEAVPPSSPRADLPPSTTEEIERKPLPQLKRRLLPVAAKAKPSPQLQALTDVQRMSRARLVSKVVRLEMPDVSGGIPISSMKWPTVQTVVDKLLALKPNFLPPNVEDTFETRAEPAEDTCNDVEYLTRGPPSPIYNGFDRFVEMIRSCQSLVAADLAVVHANGMSIPTIARRLLIHYVWLKYFDGDYQAMYTDFSVSITDGPVDQGRILHQIELRGWHLASELKDMPIQYYAGHQMASVGDWDD